jgi:hypothetical protein
MSSGALNVEHIISPSELDVMRQCPLRHSLLYGERWTKRPTDEKDARVFGTLWHSVLEGHYKAIRDQQVKAHDTLGDWRRFDQKQAESDAADAAFAVLLGVKDQEVAKTLAWMYDGHIDMYGVDPQWQIVAVEHSGEVALPGPPGVDAGGLTFGLKFKMDLIVKEQGRFWIVDNKSCKNLPNKLELDLDDQFGLYHWAGLQMGHKIFGTMHNAARKLQLKGDITGENPSALENRFRRTPLDRGKDELDQIALEAWQEAVTRYRGLAEINALKAQGLKIEAQRHPNPMTCGWKCDFTEPCIAGRKGIDIRLYIRRKGYQDGTRH